jgi:2-octaprenyl-6-methoxyphenol hydroxylase
VQQFDLAIIGGGLVGASFARAVSGLGLSIVLIDKAPEQSLYNQSLDNRGLALSYTTKELLDKLQCWEKISKKTYPIETVHVSEQKCFGFTTLESKKYNIAALGYVVSASDLGAALLNGIELLSDITVLRPATIETIVFDQMTSTWCLSVSQQKISAKLIVAADGSNSILHQLQNISIQNVNMQQSALVTNLETIIPNFTTAFERFTSHGVLALLPFGAHRAKCVFTGSNSFVTALAAYSDTEFLSIMQEFMGYRLGKFMSVAERKVFPVSHSYADPIYGDSMVLLGNAANTLHPVAAQGFNLGVRDAITLARVLQQAIATGKAVNQSVVLEQYAALRANDHAKTREFTVRLVDVFADPRPYIRLYRQAGILAAQFIPALNKKIVEQGLSVCK